MVKLILHIIVVTAIWFVVGLTGLGTIARIIAIVIGAIGVHFAWEQFFFDPLLYLGAMPVENDDPLMNAAKEKAKATFPTLESLFPNHKQDSMVKFQFETDQGVTENLWADLLSLSETTANVYIRTTPIQHEGEIERNQKIPISMIVDWQVDMPDGYIRGGFTNFALFRIFEREEGYLHSKIRSQMECYQDCRQSSNNENIEK